MSQLPPTSRPSTDPYNSLAIASLITGLFSVFGHFVVPGVGGGTLALVAIVTGFIARSEIKRSGEQGMWMATVGIVVGALHFLALLLFVFLIVAGIIVIGGFAILHR